MPGFELINNEKNLTDRGCLYTYGSSNGGSHELRPFCQLPTSRVRIHERLELAEKVDQILVLHTLLRPKTKLDRLLTAAMRGDLPFVGQLSDPSESDLSWFSQ